MKIAIQGHPTRGKEVIRILEHFGGKDTVKLEGTHKTFYYIDNKNEISDDHKDNFPPTYKLYTLEEFEKEFPFKLGDKVFWPVKTGWWSGIIVDLDPNYYKIKDDKGNYYFVESSKLRLYPMQKERNITLTLDKAKEWYNKGGELKEIALQAFTEKELKPLPRSWEEFCEKYPVKNGECWIGSQDTIYFATVTQDRMYKNWVPSKKSAEAHLAMIQLEQLRDYWRQGWTPLPRENSYSIKIGLSGLKICYSNTTEFLSFPTREMAEEFLECFRDLIEKAGDLI